MDMSTLYWLTRVEGLQSFLEGLTFFSCMVFFFSAAGYVIARFNAVEEDQGLVKKFLYVPIIAAIMWVVAAVGLVLVPSEKHLAIIFGGYYATNNEELVKSPTKAIKVINKFMDNYLEEPTKGEENE